VAARMAHAVDLDAHAHELAGAKAVPVRVGAQRQRDAARGRATSGDDLGAHLVEREGGAHQLDVAVDAVWGRERVGERRVEQAAGDALWHLSEHLCTSYGPECLLSR